MGNLFKKNKCLEEEVVELKKFTQESKKEIESLKEQIRREDDLKIYVNDHAMDLDENLENLSFSDLLRIPELDDIANQANEDHRTQNLKQESYYPHGKNEEYQGGKVK